MDKLNGYMYNGQMHLYLEHVCYLSLFCVNEERLSRLQEEIPRLAWSDTRGD
jgi:uncharacterized small protein (DUF1192 family)